MYQRGIEISFGGDRDLICPQCGCANLHQRRVEIFNRATEDSITGLHLSVVGPCISTKTEMKGNPSARRNGLIIHFTCEQCPSAPCLNVYQHKGSTYIEWATP